LHEYTLHSTLFYCNDILTNPDLMTFKDFPNEIQGTQRALKTELFAIAYGSH